MTVGQRRTAREWWPLAALTLAAGAAALISHAALFPKYSGDADEGAYVYQARMLAEGHATLPAATRVQFFWPWLFGQHGNRLFSQYQPGWPAVIAVAHLLGSEQVALVAAAIALMAAVWFLTREVDPAAAPYAGLVLLLSPIFLVHAGLYLSYLWSAALLLGSLAALLAGLRLRSWWPYVVAGALIGGAQLVRPIDALVVGVISALYAVLALRRDARALGRAVGFVVAGAAPFVLVTLVYNRHVTGGALHFPITAAEPSDTFGFGLRTLAPTAAPINYTFSRAVDSFRESAIASPRWLAGGGIGFLLALAALYLRRRHRETWLLLALVLAFPVLYFFWWASALAANGARNGLGPHYWIPTFAVLAILAGCTLREIARRWPAAVVGLVVVALAAGSAIALRNPVSGARDLSRGFVHDAKVGRDLHNAVVILRADPQPVIHFHDQFFVGDPDLRDSVLYAADRGPREAGLAKQFPDRTLYQWVQRDEPGDAFLHPSNVVEPITIASGPSVTLPFSVPEAGAIAYVMVGDTVVTQQKLASTSFSVVLVAPGVTTPAEQPGTLVARVPADGVVRVGAAFRGDLATGDRYERRFYVAVDPGTLTVQTPGLQVHLYRLNGDHWVNENVDSHLAEGQARQ